LGPIEKKTTVHFEFPCAGLIQAIGTLVAALTNRIAVMKAAAKAVAVSRAELRTNMAFPFFMSWALDWVTPCSMQGVCQMKNIVVFQCRHTERRRSLADFALTVGKFRQPEISWT
jgi:predicted MarR family transcription regulator